MGARRARSGSTSRASTPTGAPRRSPRGSRPTSAAACGPAWPRRRRCSSDGERHAGPARRRALLGARCASVIRGPNRGAGRGAYTRAPMATRRATHRAPARRRDRRGAARALSRLRAASSTASRSTRSASAGPPRRSSRRSSRAPGATPSATTRRAASVRTWLYQIARHAIIDARRRASVRPGAGAARAGGERGRRRATRSSRRCSAGRSPPRSSASRPSTAR